MQQFVFNFNVLTILELKEKIWAVKSIIPHPPALQGSVIEQTVVLRPLLSLKGLFCLMTGCYVSPDIINTF